MLKEKKNSQDPIKMPLAFANKSIVTIYNLFKAHQAGDTLTIRFLQNFGAKAWISEINS
jgi:hypothetical protein